MIGSLIGTTLATPDRRSEIKACLTIDVGRKQPGFLQRDSARLGNSWGYASYASWSFIHVHRSIRDGVPGLSSKDRRFSDVCRRASYGDRGLSYDDRVGSYAVKSLGKPVFS